MDFVVLQEAKNVGDITEVKLNTRFIFILLGPKDQLGALAEITRCMGSLFTDEVRNYTGHSISYKIACAPSEDSDQPAHPRSLIRVVAGH